MPEVIDICMHKKVLTALLNYLTIYYINTGRAPGSIPRVPIYTATFKVLPVDHEGELVMDS